MTGEEVREVGLRAGYTCRLDHERGGLWKHRKSQDLKCMHELMVVMCVGNWGFVKR